MTDEHLDKPVIYFVHHHIQERYGITFETFVRLNQQGIWQAYLAW